MPSLRRLGSIQLFGYLISPLLVAGTTVLLMMLQAYVAGIDREPHTRPYAIGYVLPIALATLVSNRRVGFFTLVLSVFATAFVLMPWRMVFQPGHVSDWVELFLLTSVGSLLVVGVDAVSKNIEAYQEVSASRARLRAVMDTAPVGVILADTSGRLTYANKEAERIWGGRISGRRDTSSTDKLSQLLSLEHGSAHRELIVEQPDESKLWVECRSTAVADDTGKTIAALSVVSDITERKTAEENLRIQAKRETTLNKINEAIRGTLDENEIQRVALNALAEALEADRCYITLFTESDTMVVPVDYHRPDLNSLQGTGKLSENEMTLSQISQRRSASVVKDIQEAPLPPLLRERSERARVRSLISVPLFDGDTLVAALVVAMADAPRDWQPHEVTLCEAVLSQTRAATAAAQAREREQRIAALLQEALLPPPPDSISGIDVSTFYLPAVSELAIGGDFYDVFPLEKNCYALVIGDVSGKGLTAASQVATVRNMLRYSLYESRTINYSVERLNAALTDHNLLSGFVTLFVATIDLGLKTVNYISAGHEPVLLRRAETGEIVELAPTGMPVGIVDDAKYEEQCLPIADGDALLLFTDGLSDAGEVRSRAIGVTGVREFLSSCANIDTASGVVQSVVASARKVSPHGFRDDVCLIAAVMRTGSRLLDRGR